MCSDSPLMLSLVRYRMDKNYTALKTQQVVILRLKKKKKKKPSLRGQEEHNSLK